MWKESLCIGVDVIDKQHKELFDKTEELLKHIHDSVEKRKEECISAILFLKDYAVRHFTAEEAYQQSIGFPDFDAHKELHVKIIQAVLYHEKMMIASDFAEKDVKKFTGMIATWLLYHVAHSDQKIGEFAKQSGQAKQTETDASHIHCDMVSNSARSVLSKMAGLDASIIKKVEEHGETFAESTTVEVGLAGDISGSFAYAYPNSFTKNLVFSMMRFTPETVDELAISVLYELSNIISGTVCGQIAGTKGILCDIQPPNMTQRPTAGSNERVALDTGIGIIETDIDIVYH